MNHPDYSLFYQQLTGRVRESGAACLLLRTAGKTATGIMYLAYPILLILLGIRGDHRILLWTIFVPAAAFAVLTAVRAKINRPRPYETWDIDPLIHKDTKGNSMPSRHVFSSAVISMAWLRILPPVGAALLVISAAAALIRVIGGVHYPSDVMIGFLAGAAAGALLFLV